MHYWTLTDDFSGVDIEGLDNEGLDIDGLDIDGLDNDGRMCGQLTEVKLKNISFLEKISTPSPEKQS